MGKYENTDTALDEAITTVQRALSTGQHSKAKTEAREAWLVVLDRLDKAALPPKP